MGECLHCKKEIQEYTGRRPKKYCSDSCRQKYFQGKNKAKAAPKKDNPVSSHQQPQNEFMGHLIPEGLSGIALAVWKNDIKLGKKKK